MKRYLSILVIFFGLIISWSAVSAVTASDSDNDGISDSDEMLIYKTDPSKKDTDGDGWSDWDELNKGFSPLNPKKVRLEKNDFDQDGLSDRLELNFGTDLSNPDTDGDGYKDGEEIKNGYDPLNIETKLLEKRLEVNLGKQELSYFLGGVKLGSFQVSSGKAGMPTPKGHYKVINKFPKAWSSYGLWMPNWMGLGTGKFGIHELPVWPNGYREGEDHLGRPVSHGCIRLGVEASKFVYNWTPVGTPVFIY